jgi:hypothetical protein
MKARRPIRRAILAALMAVAASCTEGAPTSPDASFVSVQPDAITVSFDFRDGLQGWTGEYASRYWPPREQVTFESRALPAPLDTSQRAFYIDGGLEDGLRLAKRRVAGIPANRTYSAVFSIEVATNLPRRCQNAFGPIGDTEASVHATATEPVPVSDSSGFLRPEWIAPGRISIGAITTGLPCTKPGPGTWQLKLLEGSVSAVKADAGGRLWLSLFAEDYTPEGAPWAHPFYLTKFNVVLR